MNIFLKAITVFGLVTLAGATPGAARRAVAATLLRRSRSVMQTEIRRQQSQGVDDAANRDTALNLKRKEPDSVIDGPMNSKKIDAKISDSLFDDTGPIAPEGDRKKYFLGIVCVLAVAVEEILQSFVYEV